MSTPNGSPGPHPATSIPFGAPPFEGTIGRTFGIGEDTGQPVSRDYAPPFRFTGTIERVDIELGRLDLHPEDLAAMHHTEAKARQLRE